jgi:hypothetical protein
LVSKQYKDRTEVRACGAIYLGSLARDRELQVRASADPDVHDRMTLDSGGEVHLLGHSLNGIENGSASTVLIRLPSSAAPGQAQKIKEWWTSAEPIEPAADAKPVVEANSASAGGRKFAQKKGPVEKHTPK